jgi:predicted RNase H-like nuclease (RuvC/YqgF family)
MVILEAEPDRTTRDEETRTAREEPKKFLLTDEGYAERSRNLRLQIEELRAHLSRLEAENRRFRME